jgi:trans-aconitate methyltransferase
MTNINWSEYYKGTVGNPPNPVLVKAVQYVQCKEKAIDLGAGALNETRYLLSFGFDVTTIDQSQIVEEETRKIDSVQIHPYTTSFEDFDFPKDAYDLAVSIHSLPFIEKDFDKVFERIVLSLKIGGIFCGQFFGVRDMRRNNTNRTFHTKEQVLELLHDFDILSFEEEERMRGDANVHIFHVIARKR